MIRHSIIAFVGAAGGDGPAAGTPSRARSDSRRVALVRRRPISAGRCRRAPRGCARRQGGQNGVNTSRSMSAARTTSSGSAWGQLPPSTRYVLAALDLVVRGEDGQQNVRMHRREHDAEWQAISSERTGHEECLSSTMSAARRCSRGSRRYCRGATIREAQASRIG